MGAWEADADVSLLSLVALLEAAEAVEALGAAGAETAAKDTTVGVDLDLESVGEESKGEQRRAKTV